MHNLGNLTRLSRGKMTLRRQSWCRKGQGCRGVWHSQRYPGVWAEAALMLNASFWRATRVVPSWAWPLALRASIWEMVVKLDERFRSDDRVAIRPFGVLELTDFDHSSKDDRSAGPRIGRPVRRHSSDRPAGARFRSRNRLWAARDDSLGQRVPLQSLRSSNVRCVERWWLLRRRELGTGRRLYTFPDGWRHRHGASGLARTGREAESSPTCFMPGDFCRGMRGTDLSTRNLH